MARIVVYPRTAACETPEHHAYHVGVSDASRAATEVLAGEPGPAARRWLGPLVVMAAFLFVVNTLLVVSGITRSAFDVPVERAVQSMPWGPLTYWMTLTNVTGGLVQDLLGAAVVVAVFLWDRRAGWLLALGALGSLIDQVVKVSIGRHRPTADVVAILDPSNGYSYPSGHAVFFTWLWFMVAASLSSRIRPSWRKWLWGLAGGLILLACVGRVWAGAHWPTDVIGGFLLGLAWSAFILWLPERWLPTPSRRWFRWRHRDSLVAE
jgi:membrane-associated phospholipid phosphatase